MEANEGRGGGYVRDVIYKGMEIWGREGRVCEGVGDVMTGRVGGT